MWAVRPALASPASLKLQVNTPVELSTLALAEMKCGLSACAAGTATMPLRTSVSSTINFLTVIPPLLEFGSGGATKRPLSDRWKNLDSYPQIGALNIAATGEREHGGVHRRPARGEARAARRERAAVELGHHPAGLTHDRLERGVVPLLHLRVDHHLGRPAGDEHVAPEVAQAAVAPAPLGEGAVERLEASPAHAAKPARGHHRLGEPGLAHGDRLAVHAP